MIVQQPFLADGFSTFGYSHPSPKALEIEVLPGETFERWCRRSGLSLVLRSLRGSMDLLAHFEPQNTNWIEQGEATAMPLHRCLSPWDGGRLAKVQQTKMITGLCLAATFRDYFVPSRHANRVDLFRRCPLSRLRQEHRGLSRRQRSGLLFYNSKHGPSARGRFLRGLLEDYSRNVVLTPYRFADVDGAEIVETEIELVRQLFRFKSKFDAKAETGDIVHKTRMHAVILHHDLCGMVRPGPC
jgi:hypothetical protein